MIDVRGQGAVPIYTAGVLKYRLCQSGPHVMKYHAHAENHTPTSPGQRWGTYQFVYSAYRSRTMYAIGCCTHTYNGCIKMPLDQSGPHGSVKCHANLRNGTPRVHGTAGLPMLCK